MATCWWRLSSWMDLWDIVWLNFIYFVIFFLSYRDQKNNSAGQAVSMYYWHRQRSIYFVMGSTLNMRSVDDAPPLQTAITFVCRPLSFAFCLKHKRLSLSATNMRRWPNVGLLLAHHLRRWPNSKPTMGRRPMSAAWSMWPWWKCKEIALSTEPGLTRAEHMSTAPPSNRVTLTRSCFNVVPASYMVHQRQNHIGLMPPVCRESSNKTLAEQTQHGSELFCSSKLRGSNYLLEN